MSGSGWTRAFRVLRAAPTFATTFVITLALGALGLSRFLRSFVWGLAPTDVPTLVAALACLALAGVAAAAVPAYRASRVDPARALSAD